MHKSVKNRGFTRTTFVKQNLRGFTLVELLVVISIIAILSTIGLVVYDNAQQSARDAKRKSDLHNIQTALQIYYSLNGTYPVSEWAYGSSGGTWIPGLDYKYMAQLPQDPLEPTTNCGPWGSSTCFNYAYYSSGWCGLSGKQYILVTRLETDDSTGFSQQPYLNSDNTLCGYWLGTPAAGVYTLKNF